MSDIPNDGPELEIVRDGEVIATIKPDKPTKQQIRLQKIKSARKQALRSISGDFYRKTRKSFIKSKKR